VTRLIDTLCWPHRSVFLAARMWPAVSMCTDCSYDTADLVFLPGVDERKELAIHEAGHAFALMRDLNVQYVTLANNDRFAAHTSFEVGERASLPVLTGMWAGHAAARTWLSRLGKLDPAAEIDLAQGARSDAAFICSATSDVDLINEARERADWVIARHFARIERVAEALLADGGCLTGQQVDEAAWDSVATS
jgi:hypothetical protein